ncbi:DUF4145 domain-containing protein [Rhizobium sp. TH2]|nr:DUF4145 domain-containing protein [Rhizobium sp. TH2]
MVTVTGRYEKRTHYEHNPETDNMDESEDLLFWPKSMYPAPPVIKVPEGLGKPCKEHLQVAYSLIWVDGGSCANRLRIFVEALLDQLKVPTTGPKGNRKNATWDLSDRIKALDAIDPGHKDSLDALRFVGNVGSHEGKVEFKTVLQCFQILENALEELINRKSEKLRAIIDNLVVSKGKPKA